MDKILEIILSTLFILAVIAICICFPLIIVYFITKIAIWIINGLFDYDLHNKFWYLYTLITIILFLCGTKISVNIK